MAKNRHCIVRAKFFRELSRFWARSRKALIRRLPFVSRPAVSEEIEDDEDM